MVGDDAHRHIVVRLRAAIRLARDLGRLLHQGEQEIQDSENRAGQFGFGAASVGGLAVAVGAVAAWFWVFGDDPERYVGFENEMEADRFGLKLAELQKDMIVQLEDAAEVV